MDDSYQNGVTAVAGGGQSAKPNIYATVTRVTTVATAADSVTLPQAAPGLRYKVINKAAANSLNVFPLAGDAINALSVNAAFALAATKSVEFISVAPGIWDTFPIVP
jgi:hypothetical protein